MDWTEPQYSSKEIDFAGRVLVVNSPLGGAEREHALAVISNFRRSHGYPLNTFQVGLRDKGKHIQTTPLVTQRTKRLPAIEFKLRSIGHRITLSEMQDLGGCRIVVPNVDQVNDLVSQYKQSSMRHHLIDFADYIEKPRKSGYRGRHLIYRYHSDRKDTYNDLKSKYSSGQLASTLGPPPSR